MIPSAFDVRSMLSELLSDPETDNRQQLQEWQFRERFTLPEIYKIKKLYYERFDRKN